MARKKVEKERFPKVLYVQEEEDGEDNYLICWKTIDDPPDDGEVAVYELKEVKTLITRRELE